VLEHVHGEVLGVGEPVDRPDEDGDAGPDPEPEQRDAIPADEIRAAAPPQPQDALREEERREGC
jgi:hypothetical protein